ncbi:MAG: tetratricopeptide repeat protein, partial [Alistipes sp.]|nr:tetratricopeptide repeat protein [Alistipes sp.]
MKRLILTVAAVALLAVPAVQAQKINKEAFAARLTKCDADVADAKKGAKAATWMNRGKVYFEAVEAPTKDLAENIPQNVFEIAVGKPKQVGTETIAGQEFTTLVYPYFVAYVSNGNIVGWKQTRDIQRGLLQNAVKSYNKAYELDPKQGPKVRQALDAIVNFCKKKANIGINVGDYKGASDAFAQAYDIETSPVYESADASYLFYAGRLAAVLGQNEPEMFVKGAGYLERALEAGYCDEEGSLYYYLFHCYYGQREADRAFVIKSRDALLEGIAKYPKNELILDGLMNLYTAEEGMGDPKDLVGMIDEALANDPENIDLWYGRGRVYFKLQDYDECIKSFKEVVKLRPEDSQGFYLLGVFYIC